MRSGLLRHDFTSRRERREGYYYMHSRRSPRQRCTTVALRGDALEAAVWSDIDGFLAKPGAIIRQLEQQMEGEGSHGRTVADEIREMQDTLASQAEAQAGAGFPGRRHAGASGFRPPDAPDCRKRHGNREAPKKSATSLRSRAPTLWRSARPARCLRTCGRTRAAAI